MPAFTALNVFMEAVRTGQTNITKALTTLMVNPTQWQANKDDIVVDPHLSDWLSERFAEAGMTEVEIQHIDTHWPKAQKLDLRTHVLNAIDSGRPMVFSWTLTNQPHARTHIVWPAAGAPPQAPVIVTFRSPGAGVSHTTLANGEVDVTVAV